MKYTCQTVRYNTAFVILFLQACTLSIITNRGFAYISYSSRYMKGLYLHLTTNNKFVQAVNNVPKSFKFAL